MINDVFSTFSQAIRKFIGSKSIPSTTHSAHGKPSSTTMSVMNGNATTMSVANRVTKFPVNEMNSDLLVKQLIDSDFIYSRKVINKRIPNIIESSINAAINGENLNVKESICTLDIFKLNKSIKQFVKILETLKLRQKLQFYVLCKNKHYLRLIDRMAKNYLLNKIIKTCTILPDLSHESRDTTKFLFVLGEYELTETFLYRLVYYRINIISNLNLKYERKTSGFYKIQNNLDDYKKLIFLFIFIQKILGKKNDSISFDHFSDTTTHSARRTLRDPVPSGHRRPSSTIHSVHRNNKNIITTHSARRTLRDPVPSGHRSDTTTQATPIAAVNAIHSGHRRPSSTTTTGGSSSVTAMNNVNRVTKFPTTEGSSGRKSVPSAHRKPSFTAINNVNS